MTGGAAPPAAADQPAGPGAAAFAAPAATADAARAGAADVAAETGARTGAETRTSRIAGIGALLRGRPAPLVFYWPDYTNPYQDLLYARARARLTIRPGPLETALAHQRRAGRPGAVVFHLHWLNFLLYGIRKRARARRIASDYAAMLEAFSDAGGRIVWTIHNTLSHEVRFAELERALSVRVAELAHVLHLHARGAAAEVGAVFPLPPDKIRVSPLGSYRGVYPDTVSRAQARDRLGLDAQDDVILFFGQVRPYKGVAELVRAFRIVLPERPRARLVIAGARRHDPLAAATPALDPAERARIVTSAGFIDPLDTQHYFRAADFAVFPYRQILTSSTLMLALGFDLPAVVADVAMTRESLSGGHGGGPNSAGLLIAPGADADDLAAALRRMLAAKDSGALSAMARRAGAIADAADWPDFGRILLARPESKWRRLIGD